VTTVLSGSAMLLMTIYPALIYPAWDVENYFSGYFSFHTVTFHGLVYFAYLLMPDRRAAGATFGRATW
jgi:hypothetical protein